MLKSSARQLPADLASRVGTDVFTFEFIKGTMRKLSDLEVADEIVKFVNEGKLQQFVVVTSADGERVLGEFKSILDIPALVYDAESDADVVVCPSDLIVLYRFPK